MDRRERLEIKIEKLRKELEKSEGSLDKITPHKPLIHKDSYWNAKTRQLDSSYEYYCDYCGEKLRKGTKKHKCGQMIDWSEVD